MNAWMLGIAGMRGKDPGTITYNGRVIHGLPGVLPGGLQTNSRTMSLSSFMAGGDGSGGGPSSMGPQLENQTNWYKRGGSAPSASAASQTSSSVPLEGWGRPFYRGYPGYDNDGRSIGGSAGGANTALARTSTPTQARASDTAADAAVKNIRTAGTSLPRPQQSPRAIPVRCPHVNLGMNVTNNNEFQLNHEKAIEDAIAEIRKRLLKEFNVVQSQTRLMAAMIDRCNSADLM